MQRQEMSLTRDTDTASQQQMQMQYAGGVKCPHCGAINDPEAIYCGSCGQPIGKTSCPNCGAEMDPDADFCESCRRYIKTDVCSFCGARISSRDAFCPECGNPRGGIVCPVCHTLNDFAFCKQCGTPLTDEARQLSAELGQRPDYQEMMKLARELDELQLQLPYSSERDVVREQMNQKLRERVLTLLAKDRGKGDIPVVPEPTKRLSKEELDRQKEERVEELTRLLEAMALPPQPSPVKARNYAMAQKPLGVRLAWVCNYKGAMHSSPCGCAKPQLGGKWIILGKGVLCRLH